MIERVTVSDGHLIPETEGDIWPITWADDDDLYTAANDSSGNPAGLFRRGPATPVRPMLIPGVGTLPGRNVSVARVTGSADRPTVMTVNPMESLLGRLEYDGPHGSWKASGILAHRSVLYLVAFHHRYHIETQRQPWFTGTHPAVLVSRDYGASWSTPAEARAVEDPYRFGSPSFVQHGRDGGPDRDGYVYLISPGEGRFLNNDTLLLARAPADAVERADRWQYWQEGASPGTWGPIAAATPIITATGSLGAGPETVYLEQLGSYVLLTWSAPGVVDVSSTWQAAEQAFNDRTLLHIYQGERLMGPWRRVYSGRPPGRSDYNPRLPLKWVSADGTSARMVSAGNFLHAPEMPEHYGFVTSRIHFEFGASPRSE